MRLANEEKRAGWLPFIVLVYVETLRYATFYAFGWGGRGQALAIVSLIVTVYVFVDYFFTSGTKKNLIGLVGLSYVAMVWVINKVETTGQFSLLGEFFFGLPNFRIGTISSFEYATFCFFVVFFYALVILLLTTFILEKKSITEMFFAGVILLGIEIVTSDRGITGYVVGNVVSSIVLASQVNLLQVANDRRIRDVKGSGIKTNTWVGVSLVFALGLTLFSSLLPFKSPSIDVNSVGGNLIKQFMGNNAPVENESGGRFGVFWKKMQGFELAGAVPVENNPVMYVKSETPSYWRGESVDFYTGSGWKSHLSPKITDAKSFDNPYSRDVAVKQVEQVFSLAKGMTTEVVFSSGSPAKVEIPGGTLAWDEGDNLYTSQVNPGISYKVISYIPDFNPEKLKRTSQDYPFNIKSLYLQLPQEVPDRVRLLADKLTQGAGNPYDKVKAIETYLSSNYQYDLTVSAAPAGRDVVDYFLFDLGKGYCTYHSTAMVVMLRSIGIPARWVKGFATGTVDPDTGVYKVNMSDAHAWVEVYFADFGWVPFDPTPSFAIPGSAPWPDEAPALREAQSQTVPSQAVPKVSPNEILQRKEHRAFPWGLVIIMVLMIIGGLTCLYLRRTRNMFKFGSGDKIRDTYLSFVRLLAHKGYPKDASQTPFEYAKGLKDKFPDDYPDIESITEAYLKEKYGKDKLEKTEIENIRNIWKRLSEKWLGKSRD